MVSPPKEHALTNEFTGRWPLAMHAPDGLFSMSVNVLFGVVVVALLAAACRSLTRRYDQRAVPVMGVLAAFVFAAQMVNFPVASGTTGHLLGGTLTAILLGPWAGLVVMTVVVGFQALLGDGGITVLGPNIFNMGVVGTCLGYYVYRAVAGQREPGGNAARVVGAACFAAWLAVVLASAFASVQLAVSGTASLSRALPAMVGVHMLIGIGEALITAGVVAFVVRTRPELLYGQQATDAKPSGRGVIVVGLTGALVVAAGLSLLPMLWDYPDGLERVGLERGFIWEEPEYGPDGALAQLPAYPLGVRLGMLNDQVGVVHRYDSCATPLAAGDVLLRIDSTSTPDLAAAAQALGFDAQRRCFGTSVGSGLHVMLWRDGQERQFDMSSATAPRAGTVTPLLALLPDYALPGMPVLLGTSLAGVLGALVMFVVAGAIGRLLVRTPWRPTHVPVPPTPNSP